MAWHRSEMEPNGFQISGMMIAPTALIAQPIPSDALVVIAAVSALGFEVTVTETFHAALERLRVPPDLLVADIRLNEYNGLHLVLRGKAAKADLTALVTCSQNDTVLCADAEKLGATFVVTPTTAAELRAAICRTWRRREESSDAPIRPPFERRHSERRTEAGRVAVDRRVADRRRTPAQLIRYATPGG